MPFISDFKWPSRVQKTALWFLFHDQQLLARLEKGRYVIPNSLDLEALHLVPIHQQFMGTMDERSCYAGELADEKQISEAYAFIGLREILSCFEEDLIPVAGLANQLVQWNRNHQYCGKCGKPTENKTDERARICPRCGLINYPRLSPAVIVAVIRDDRILLANSQRFPTKFYSVLAGFVEPGETLEQCVEREILEEVGIHVKNIRYFGSQPWPYPDSLMVAFTAEYAGGEIKTDDAEIADAGWFSADNMPVIPSSVSIARHLIDWFLEGRNEVTEVRGAESS